MLLRVWETQFVPVDIFFLSGKIEFVVVSVSQLGVKKKKVTKMVMWHGAIVQMGLGLGGWGVVEQVRDRLPRAFKSLLFKRRKKKFPQFCHDF